MQKREQLYRFFSYLFLTCALAFGALAHVPVQVQDDDAVKQEQKKEQSTDVAFSTLQTQATVQAPALLPMPDLFVVQDISLPVVHRVVSVDQVSKEQLSYFVNLFLSSICVNAP